MSVIIIALIIITMQQLWYRQEESLQRQMLHSVSVHYTLDQQVEVFFSVSQTSHLPANCVGVVWPPERAAADTSSPSTSRSETMFVMYAGKALSSSCEFHLFCVIIY